MALNKGMNETLALLSNFQAPMQRCILFRLLKLGRLFPPSNVCKIKTTTTIIIFMCHNTAQRAVALNARIPGTPSGPPSTASSNTSVQNQELVWPPNKSPKLPKAKTARLVLGEKESAWIPNVLKQKKSYYLRMLWISSSGLLVLHSSRCKDAFVKNWVFLRKKQEELSLLDGVLSRLSSWEGREGGSYSPPQLCVLIQGEDTPNDTALPRRC